MLPAYLANREQRQVLELVGEGRPYPVMTWFGLVPFGLWAAATRRPSIPDRWARAGALTRQRQAPPSHPPRSSAAAPAGRDVAGAGVGVGPRLSLRRGAGTNAVGKLADEAEDPPTVTGLGGSVTVRFKEATDRSGPSLFAHRRSKQ